MPAKRGDRVAPPAASGQWDLRFATTSAAKGWDSLCQQTPANAAAAWSELRERPERLSPTGRHHQLKGRLSTAVHRGVEMEQWQYEVTAAGRVWYLIDTAEKTLWLRHAGPGHPKETE